MASNQTEYLGLNQWEAQDTFLRREFNTDNQIISQAVWERKEEHSRLAEELRTLGYDTYQLLLRDYYEGHDVSYKKGIVFDGFLDDSKIAAKDPALFCGGQSIALCQNAEADWSTSHSGTRNDVSRYNLSTAIKTAVGAGEITSCLLYYSSEQVGASKNYILDMVVNGAVARSSTFHLTGTTTTLTTTVTFERPVPVAPGDQYSFVLSKDKNGASSAFYFGLTAGSDSQIACTVHLIGRGAKTGAMTTATLGGQKTGRGTLYVHYSEGLVIPTLGEKKLELEAHRQTVTANGIPCVEDRWAIRHGEDNMVLTFELTCGESEKCVFHDYGLLLF